MVVATRWQVSWQHGISGMLWVGACAVALYWAMSYDFTPGRLGARRTHWPTELDSRSSTPLIRTPGTTSVLAFLHPRCVCTRATVTQLVRTLQAHPDVELIVPVFVPLGAADRQAWEETEYVKTIRAAFPRARIVFDAGGLHAERFGAYTSGTVLVYDAQGREIFRGGITDRRGGDGENPGRQQLVSAISKHARVIPARPAPVFGCPLVASSGGEKGSAR